MTSSEQCGPLRDITEVETAIFFHFCLTRYNHDHRKQDLMGAMEESPRGCEEEERARNKVVWLVDRTIRRREHIRTSKGSFIRILLWDGQHDPSSRCLQNSWWNLHFSPRPVEVAAQDLQAGTGWGETLPCSREGLPHLDSICHLHPAERAPKLLAWHAGLPQAGSPSGQPVHNLGKVTVCSHHEKKPSGQHQSLRNLPWLCVQFPFQTDSFDPTLPLLHLNHFTPSFSFLGEQLSAFPLRSEASLHCPHRWNLY